MTHMVKGGSHVTRHVHVCGFRFHGLGRLTHDGDTHGLGQLSHDLCHHELTCVVVCTNKYVAWSRTTSDVLIHELIRFFKKTNYSVFPDLFVRFFIFVSPDFFQYNKLWTAFRAIFRHTHALLCFQRWGMKRDPQQTCEREKRPVKETCVSDKRS